MNIPGNPYLIALREVFWSIQRATRGLDTILLRDLCLLSAEGYAVRRVGRVCTMRMSGLLEAAIRYRASEAPLATSRARLPYTFIMELPNLMPTIVNLH